MVRESVNRGASPSAPARKAGNVSEQIPRGASSGIERSAAEAYLTHHWYSARTSLKRLLSVPFASLLTWMVIAVALALPAGLMVVLDNLSGLTKSLESSSQLTVYMKRDRSDEQSSLLAKQIAARVDVAMVEYIDRQQALTEFKEVSGWGDVLVYLDENPLPTAIVVQPAAVLSNDSEIGGLVNDLQALPGVDSVQIDLQWLNRLRAVFVIIERFLLSVAIMFGMAVVLIIGNTIRLAIENRSEEIVVVKLVGGTDAYVKRPFLYTGFWYGIVGAGIAWLILKIALVWLEQPVNELAELYYSEFGLQGLGWGESLYLLLIGGLLGTLGAWLAVMRHLDLVEPS